METTIIPVLIGFFVGAFLVWLLKPKNCTEMPAVTENPELQTKYRTLIQENTDLKQQIATLEAKCRSEQEQAAASRKEAENYQQSVCEFTDNLLSALKTLQPSAPVASDTVHTPTAPQQDNTPAETADDAAAQTATDTDNLSPANLADNPAVPVRSETPQESIKRHLNQSKEL